MTDNGLLIGLTLLEGVEPMLKADKREQLSRASLTSIHTALIKVLEYISKADLSNIYISGRLIDITDTIDMLMKEENFIETDTEVKEIIAKKVLESLSELYLEVGKYYTKVDFDYTPRMDPVLRRIIDRCFNAGYYFELDMKSLIKEVKQEAVQ